MKYEQARLFKVTDVTGIGLRPPHRVYSVISRITCVALGKLKQISAQMSAR